MVEFALRFKFSSVDEIIVESMHAKIEQHAANVTNRSMAYDSLLVRFPFFAGIAAEVSRLQAVLGRGVGKIS